LRFGGHTAKVETAVEMFNQALAGTRSSPLRFPDFSRLPAMTRVLSPDSDHGFATRAIHAGQVPDPLAGAVMPPVYQTSTYIQDGLGRHKGYEYARTQNPTRAAFEANIAAIEKGKAGFAFASGMAAEGAIMTLLKSGDHVVVTDNTYGGTYRLFEQVLRRYQLDFTYVDTSDTTQIEQAMRPATKMLFLE